MQSIPELPGNFFICPMQIFHYEDQAHFYFKCAHRGNRELILSFCGNILCPLRKCLTSVQVWFFTSSLKDHVL